MILSVVASAKLGRAGAGSSMRDLRGAALLAAFSGDLRCQIGDSDQDKVTYALMSSSGPMWTKNPSFFGRGMCV